MNTNGVLYVSNIDKNDRQRFTAKQYQE